MLIRKPAAEVYQAFVDPAVTTRFWFTKSSGPVEPGRKLRWDWEMYGVHGELEVKAAEPGRRIHIQWADGSEVEWSFEERPDRTTMVKIAVWNFSGDQQAQTAHALDNMGGYTFLLAGAKAYLEHGLQLNLVADKAPV